MRASSEGTGQGTFQGGRSVSAGVLAETGERLTIAEVADFDGSATPDLVFVHARMNMSDPVELGFLASQARPPYVTRLLGRGSGGARHAPRVDRLGPPVTPNEHFALRLSMGPPGAPYLWMAGPWRQDVQVHGDLWLHLVPLAFHAGALDATGRANWSLPLRGTGLANRWAYVQAWVIDPTANVPVGVSSTPGLALRFGLR